MEVEAGVVALRPNWKNNSHREIEQQAQTDALHLNSHIQISHTDINSTDRETEGHRDREKRIGDRRREKVKQVQVAAEMACALVRKAASSSSSHRSLASLFSALTAGSTRGFSSDSALQIKALRERTGAPIKDVKAALLQCEWDAGSSGVSGMAWMQRLHCFDRLVLVLVSGLIVVGFFSRGKGATSR